MFADPQSITVNAVAQSLPRISSKDLSATYQKDDQSFKMTISHLLSAGRVRTMVRVDQRAVVPDPLTSVNDWETLSFYFVIDRPEVGFSAAQVDFLVQGLKTWLDTTADAKLFGLQS